MILNVTSSKGSISESVKDISTQIKDAGSEPVMTLLFASSCLDLKELEVALQEANIPGKVLACTTSGEISQKGISDNGIVGQVYFGDEFVAETFSIDDLHDISNEKNVLRFSEINEYVKSVKESHPTYNSFGILLVDGMSVREEEVCGFLSSCLGALPIVGGSAGDDLSFSKTYIYEDGEFRDNYASVTVLSTSRKFKVFKSQHFKPTESKMVITSAIPERRIVQEINGEPAADYYARLLNKEVKDLTPLDFSQNPLMLEINGEPFVRSIQKVNDDNSLTFYCAIDTGIVMILAEIDSISDTNNKLFSELSGELGNIDHCLLFECILRKLEILEMSEEDKKKVLDIYNDYNAIGFYTYGEQFDHVHINQTLIGVAFGK